MKLNYVDNLAYGILFLAMVIGVVSILSLKYDPLNQFVVILSFSIFYLLWGIVYHLFRRDINLKLFLEYLIIASIASVVGFLVFVS